VLGKLIKASSFFQSIARWPWWNLPDTTTARSKAAFAPRCR